MKKVLIVSLLISLLCLTACNSNIKDSNYTGGDTSVGGLFYDILFGED